MLKTIALVSGLLTMGFASQAHADFFHLGAGGCRTPSGGGGTVVRHQNVSWKECRTKCIEHDSCKAVEFTMRYDGDSACEVHINPINHAADHIYRRTSITSCWGYTP